MPALPVKWFREDCRMYWNILPANPELEFAYVLDCLGRTRFAFVRIEIIEKLMEILSVIFAKQTAINLP